MTVRYGANEVQELLNRLNTEPADALENQWLDFKEWPAHHGNERANMREQRKTALEAAVCFANAQGGTVVFGVKDKIIGVTEACTGVPLSTNVESLQRHVIDSTDPKIFPKFERLAKVNETSDPLLLMFIEPATMPPCSSSEGFSFRVDKNCLKLTGSLIRSIYFQSTSPNLSQISVNKVVETLLVALQGGDSREANTAVNALAKIGEASMNDLIVEWLSNYSEAGNIDAVARIRNTWARMKGDQEIAKYVLGCLDVESADRLPAFIAASAAIAPGQAVEPIGMILRDHPTPSVRAQAVRSLAEIGYHQAYVVLNEHLLVETDVGVLKDLMDRIEPGIETILGFCKLIKHSAWPIREKAARALGSVGSAEPLVIQTLAEGAADVQIEVVFAAIDSLKMIGGNDAENVLRSVLDDPVGQLEAREYAIKALISLRRQ